MRTVEEVQRIYGDSFDLHFSYLKKGKAVVVTAPSEIVKQYRELQAGSARSSTVCLSVADHQT